MRHTITSPTMLATLAALAALLLPACNEPASLVTPPDGASGPARFELSADTVLLDEPVGIALSGLAPGASVTVRVTGLESARGWRAAATFEADRRGRVDLTRAAPIGGDYAGVHAMGLFWSADPDSGAAPPPYAALRSPAASLPSPQPWELTAEVDGQVLATDTLWRRATAPGVRVTAVRERGLVGMLYSSPEGGRRPTVVVLTGSGGGMTSPSGTPGGLASRGYTVLELGYFAAEGLPAQLARIPLEYFDNALRWLAEQPSVDPARIAVLGESRGGELALLLGATYPAVHAVVAYVPSYVAWPGAIADPTGAPAWTLAGQPVPGMYARETDEAVARHAGCPEAPTCAVPLTLHQFLARLDDSVAAARAEIAVERINGAVLLLSGRDDRQWPSALMADRALSRLRARGFRHPAEHVAYADAGHGVGLGRPYVGTRFVTRGRVNAATGRMTIAGGTAEGTALALEDSWRRVLAFLDANLGATR
jgi:dienelactone hydrolase